MRNERDLPLILRGELIAGDGDPICQADGVRYSLPLVRDFVDRLPLGGLGALSALSELRLDDIVSYLSRLGDALEFGGNPHIRQAALGLSSMHGLPMRTVQAELESMRLVFKPEFVTEMVTEAIGGPYLERWVERPSEATHRRTWLRALGCRMLHVIAGNAPAVAAISIVRSAVTRSDSIIKLPSNDPFTAHAIARTMLEMDPAHPISRSVTVGYWKGGDESVERKLYRSAAIDKLIVWGGESAIGGVSRYNLLGVDVIRLEPKYSVSVLHGSSLRNGDGRRQAAHLLANDVGLFNQRTCFNSRIAYVVADEEGDLEAVNRFGSDTADALAALPADVSAPQRLPGALSMHIDSLEMLGDAEFRVFRRGPELGAAVVSQGNYTVDFAASLDGRAVNIVPVPDVGAVMTRLSHLTQTAGVYPAQFELAVRDRFALKGVQRIVPLGQACREVPPASPQDGMEILRRMCRWVSHERGVA